MPPKHPPGPPMTLGNMREPAQLMLMSRSFSFCDKNLPFRDTHLSFYLLIDALVQKGITLLTTRRD